MLPVRVTEELSPKFTTIAVIEEPLDAVAAMVNVIALLVTGDAEPLIVTARPALVPRTIEVDAEPLAPDESVAVAVTV